MKIYAGSIIHYGNESYTVENQENIRLNFGDDYLLIPLEIEDLQMKDTSANEYLARFPSDGWDWQVRPTSAGGVATLYKQCELIGTYFRRRKHQQNKKWVYDNDENGNPIFDTEYGQVDGSATLQVTVRAFTEADINPIDMQTLALKWSEMTEPNRSMLYYLMDIDKAVSATGVTKAVENVTKAVQSYLPVVNTINQTTESMQKVCSTLIAAIQQLTVVSDSAKTTVLGLSSKIEAAEKQVNAIPTSVDAAVGTIVQKVNNGAKDTQSAFDSVLKNVSEDIDSAYSKLEELAKLSVSQLAGLRDMIETAGSSATAAAANTAAVVYTSRHLDTVVADAQNLVTKMRGFVKESEIIQQRAEELDETTQHMDNLITKLDDLAQRNFDVNKLEIVDHAASVASSAVSMAASASLVKSLKDDSRSSRR